MNLTGVIAMTRLAALCNWKYLLCFAWCFTYKSEFLYKKLKDDSDIYDIGIGNDLV
ncbi:hypothetical protein SAMN05216302_102837 [Nitrosomonas aestuarii]|uniref:Uncharacterized protein n=1 Tax=Nitrosomonas aestuarii TaxID=52441 RepID=A0A1I4EIH3_9PROT|nr:hypothetical protein SAMN05216302_102837 [Nitrosomonas aestuarii]